MTEQTVPQQTENGTIEGTATELAPAPAAPPSLFGTTDPSEVVVKATAVADALADVINRKRLFVKVGDKHHVLVDGWQLLGSMLGVTAVCVATEEIDGGYKATVEARTMDGRVVGRADAVCTKDEKRGPWKGADDYARLSMAQTRATSKALKGPLGFIVSLAGYEPTPAEEMTFAEQTKPEAADASPTEADQPPRISATDAAALYNAFKASGAKVDALKLKLGSLGVEGKMTSAKQAIGLLTEPQADELFVWIGEQS